MMDELLDWSRLVAFIQGMCVGMAFAALLNEFGFWK